MRFHVMRMGIEHVAAKVVGLALWAEEEDLLMECTKD